MTPDAIDDALAQAVQAYAARNPASQRQLADAEASMPAGNTRSVLFHSPFPLTMVRGEGCRLQDADGHWYLDALGEFTAGIYGHSEPAIAGAIAEALAEGLNLSSHNRREAALAHELRRRFPAMRRLRFTNSGTEANLLAIASAVAFTGRRKVMVFRGGYHGGVLSFGGHSEMNVPHDWAVARYNDLADVRAHAAAHPGEFAAILVEPMLGAGGCIPGQPAFLHGLREVCDETGALLIVDEVMTSRLSEGGRVGLLQLSPDLLTLGKYFGGGLSFGAFGGREDVMAHYDPRHSKPWGHAGTFNNNTLTMAAGMAGLAKVLSRDALARLNALGDDLRARLNALCRSTAPRLQFTGLGSVMQLQTCGGEVRCPEDLAAADDRIRALLFFDLLEMGVFLARRGLVALSLPWGAREVDEFTAAFANVIARRRCLLQ